MAWIAADAERGYEPRGPILTVDGGYPRRQTVRRSCTKRITGITRSPGDLRLRDRMRIRDRGKSEQNSRNIEPD